MNGHIKTPFLANRTALIL